MALVKLRPTSAGTREVVKVVDKGLHKGKPHMALVEKKTKNAGRNNTGRITVRHQGGGHRQHYRVIDFRRDKDNIPAIVERIEYDPNRSAHIALLCYRDGERRYIIAPKDLAVGATVLSGSESPIQVGNAMMLRDIPVGSTVHCVELRPGKGAQLARSAGAWAQIMARDVAHVQLRLRSGEVRIVNSACKATLGVVGNGEHMLRSLGKAGAKRWRGIRPTVRGVAMNPIDHPHGGGEGRTSGGRDPCTPWGVPTKGYRTRRNKRTQRFIISRRKK